MMKHFATGIFFSSVPISDLWCFGVAELQNLPLAADHIVEANNISPPGVSVIDQRKTTTNHVRTLPSTDQELYICYFHRRFVTDVRTCLPGLQFAKLLLKNQETVSNI